MVICPNLSGSVWICTKLNDLVVICVYIYGSVANERICVNLSEFVKVCSDLCGFVMIYVDLYEVA